MLPRPRPSSPAPGSGPGARAARRSDPERLEAFSDGVMAVIITIMALELKTPKGGRLSDFGTILPGILVYILSFTVIGIYWNNHHHLLRSTERISAGVMWANLHLLFWLSLVPFMTSWVAEFYRAHLPACAYAVVSFGAGIAYSILVRAIVAANGADSHVALAVGDDRKGMISLLLYALAIGLAWVTPWVSYGLFATVSLTWFVPDRRLERVVGEGPAPG